MEVEDFTEETPASATVGYPVAAAGPDEWVALPKRERFWPWVLGLVMMIALLIILNSGLFEIHQIIVKGNRKLSDEAIILTAGISKRQSLWRLNRSSLTTALLGHPLIADVKLNFLYPDRLVIAIRERHPVCRIGRGNREWIIGNDLVVLGNGPEENQLQLPEVTGLGNLRLKPRMPLNQTGLNSILQLIAFSPRQLGGTIRRIDLGSKTVLIEAFGNRELVTVLLGDFNRIGEKTALLRAVLARNQTGAIIGIDLRVPGVSTVTTSMNIIP